MLKRITRDEATALMLMGAPVYVPRDHWWNSGDMHAWQGICHACLTVGAVKEKWDGREFWRTYFHWGAGNHRCDTLPDVWTEFYVKTADEADEGENED